MGKQDKIIESNKDQIDKWIKEDRPITWIINSLKISMEKFKMYYGNYKPFKKKSGITSDKINIYNKVPKICLCCNKKLDFLERHQKFCSRSCSATFNNTKGKMLLTSKDYYLKPKRCTTCNAVIPFKLRHKNVCNLNCKIVKNSTCKICGKKIRFDRKTCSRECLRQHFIENAKVNALGSLTGVNKYKYKDVWMDSKWEVKIAQFLDENNITWLRSNSLEFLYELNNEPHRYYPDFYLPEYDMYLDPKNSFKMKLDESKIRNVIERYNIRLWVGDVNVILDDLQNLFLASRTI